MKRSASLTAIDLFAGAGGSSEGARMAGVHVKWAANHWRKAIDIHELNHPHVQHACQDLHQFDFRETPEVDIMLASPACQGHSSAASGGGRYVNRGTAPRNDADRSTAWAVVSCLEATRTRLGVVENVPEFRKWVLYPAWCAALQSLGYSMAEHVIDAADHGVPQHRKRLFITLVRGRVPLQLRLPTQERVPISSVLDLQAGVWRPTSSLPPASQWRIVRSRERYPVGAFLTHYVSDDHGHSIDAPMRSVTTKHQWAIVRRLGGEDKVRMFTSREYAGAMGFPVDYQLTGAVTADCHLLGNAVSPPVMRAILQDVIARA